MDGQSDGWMEPGEVMSRAEAMARLGISESNLEKRITRHPTHYRRADGKVFIAYVELEKASAKLRALAVPDVSQTTALAVPDWQTERDGLKAELTTCQEQLRRARRDIRGLTETIRLQGRELADLRDAMARMSPHNGRTGPQSTGGE